MEFAAGIKLVMVLGHEACGAAKGACDDVKLSNLTKLPAKIKPATDSVEGYDGERNSKDKEFVDKVFKANIRPTLTAIRKRIDLLAFMEEEGKIKIVGAIYSLHNGEVTLLD